MSDLSAEDDVIGNLRRERDEAVTAMKDICYALFRSNIDWSAAERSCGDPKCCGDCRYLRDVRRLVRDWDGGILR